jgi:hypothetical protein
LGVSATAGADNVITLAIIAQTTPPKCLTDIMLHVSLPAALWGDPTVHAAVL